MDMLIGSLFVLFVLFGINVVILRWVLRINCIIERLDTIARLLKTTGGVK